MMRGDCPDFCMRAASQGLYRSVGTVVISDYGASPLEGVAQRLDQLSKIRAQSVLDELRHELESYQANR